MIPDSVILAAFALSILGASISWGHAKTPAAPTSQKEASK